MRTVTQPRFVQVQQPTVPHYRVPFFDALAARLPALTVSTSRTTPGGPDSAGVERMYLDASHSCISLWGGRLLWQAGIEPRQEMGRGDVLVVAGNPRYLSTLKLVHLARRRGIGIVWWTHGWSPTSKEWRARIRHRLLQSADCVLAYTDDEAMALRRVLGGSVPVLGAQNAIDQSPLKSATAQWPTERVRDFQKQQGLDGRLVLLFCGRLRRNPSSGVGLLLSAMSKLLHADPRYLAIVIGDGEEKQQLTQQAAMLGVQDNIRWLGGMYREEESAPWFLSARCFVYPGSIGLSILHGMGYGLPVVTHDNRRHHSPEIAALRPGFNGLAFREGDAGDLARQIEAICTHEQLQRDMSAQALRTVECEFSIDNMVSRFVQSVAVAAERSSGRVQAAA